MPPTSRRLLGFARSLRSRQTKAERKFWRGVRAHRFHGMKFCRQFPVGPFIADFCCRDRKVIVEIDGDVHWEKWKIVYDMRREIYLRVRGYRVVRFTNNQILSSMSWVLEELRRQMALSAARASAEEREEGSAERM